MKEVTIRVLTPNDVPAVKALFASAMSDPFRLAFRLVLRAIAPLVCV